MPPRELIRAVDALNQLDAVTVREGLRQQKDGRKWILKIRLCLTDLPVDTQVPRETHWYVLIEDTYPWGSIEIHPSKENSITATFPHQRRNHPGNEGEPWRNGDICVSQYGHILGRSGAITEPRDPDERLRWHLERAVAWLEIAAHGNLQQPGDPYEVPEFDTGAAPNRTLAFNETYDSFEDWKSVSGSWGTVELRQLAEPMGTLATGEFRDQDDHVIHQPEWGDYIKNNTEDVFPGAWILLDSTPFEPPWEAPETWRALENVLEDAPIKLYELMGKVSSTVTEEDVQILLIGFPIPEEIGDPDALIRWQAVKLPSLKRPAEHAGGYRNTERDREILARVDLVNKEIQWLDSENWAHEQLARRGSLSKPLSETKVLLIGTGALGSTLAECLVRGGVQELTLVDGETFEIGNLARHTLTLADVGEKKATALAERLQSLTPHASVEAIIEDFPPTDESRDAVVSSEIVIDCTGSNAVLEALRRFPWKHPTLFTSASMGRRGNRLFVYSAYDTIFPHNRFRKALEPWLLQERLEWSHGEDAVPERVGCWHPASVVQMDRVTTWAGTISRHLDQTTDLGHGQYDLTVLETQAEGEVPLVSEAEPPFQDAIEWTSADSSITVRIPADRLAAVKDLCAEAREVETGGILAGTYFSGSEALVVRATDPPSDSTHGPTTFHRGTEQVDEWLQAANERLGIQYLGEWHYHPAAPPEASDDDHDEMVSIATNESYHCPDPILVIVGGTPPDDLSVNVYVFHREGDFEELHRANPEDEPEDSQ
ncbi:ThiF family adenylyltransferase [Saliphagus infecundisoli]|uniref:ThiF family adenylyltransferase n=1 Tax=Saliphagus infecundisoli TaxID=1849069 RepID=A0ABD5QIP7_9EURY|nr:ThiF family adenylyltransferase [Saliphagus infecundisoli]